MAAVWAALAASAAASAPPARSAGILYEVWHSEAAMSMAQVAAAGHPQLTTETVIRSDGNATLDDVYPGRGPPWFSADIWNVQPAELGFYCMYRARPNPNTTKPTNPPTPYFPPPIPDCPMAGAVAKRHASMLVEAGFDYVAVDITNWPQVNAATDVAVLRPLEVLMDEWLALRAAGVPTPLVAAWCASPVASYPSGQQTTWQWLLDHVYNNATRAPLLWRRPSQPAPPAGQPLKRTFFVPDNGLHNASVDVLIAANGGKNDVEVVRMWAMMGKQQFDGGSWGFFSGCTDASGVSMTTSMVGTGRPCDQLSTRDPATGRVAEVSASGAYMVAQCALPWASPGHLRGLTLQRLFAEVLAAGAPDLFVSSFNEHIGGRQPPSQHSATAFNMGLPNDPQAKSVWVDTYASEFSRDLEPSVEAGDAVWRVAASCVTLYKQRLMCNASAAAAASPCCTTDDKLIWNNAWSLWRPPPPPPARPGRVTCPPGQVVDWVQTHEDNGSCDCALYCAADWGHEVSAQRPHWTGATSYDTGTAAMCRCVQASRWCDRTGKGGCGAACGKEGPPEPANYCVPAPPPSPPAPLDFAVTASPEAKKAMTAPGAGWTEMCAGTFGSSVFCVGDFDGREGPFMLYSVASAVPGAVPLFRCANGTAPSGGGGAGNFLSTSPTCEVSGGKPVEQLGWVSPRRGGETLRALRRCRVDGHPNLRKHALDLPCNSTDAEGVLLGFVR